jgi:hypothetical protein
MKTLVTVNLVILVVVFGIIVIFIGLDLKKWRSWLFGAYSFLSAFLFTLISTGNINESLMGGAIIAFALMFAGATTHLTKEHAKRLLQEHEKKSKRTSTKKSH